MINLGFFMTLFLNLKAIVHKSLLSKNNSLMKFEALPNSPN